MNSHRNSTNRENKEINVGQNGSGSPYRPMSGQADNIQDMLPEERQQYHIMTGNGTSVIQLSPSSAEESDNKHRVTSPNGQAIDPQRERQRTPDSGATKDRECGIVHNTNKKDTARMLAALDPSSCSADKLAAARELRHLVRNADESYWAEHCPQVIIS